MLPRNPLVVKLNRNDSLKFTSKWSIEDHINTILKNQKELKIEIFYSIPPKTIQYHFPFIALLPSRFDCVFYKKPLSLLPFPYYFFKKEKDHFFIYDTLWINFFTKLPPKKIILSSPLFTYDLDQKPNLPSIFHARLKKKIFFENDYLDLSLKNLATRKLVEQLSKKKINWRNLYFFFFNKLLKGFCH